MKAPWTKKEPIRAASGAPHSGPTSVKLDFIAKRQERWQERVLELATSVPEPSGAIALIENTLNRVIFRIEGKIRAGDQKALEKSLNAFDKGRAGMLLWLVGECYPVWRPNELGEIEWEVNSPSEVVAETNRPLKILGSDDKPRLLHSSERIYRLWRRHPKKKYMAWSPHQGLVDVLEAMYLHQLSDTAVATSRLAGAGILYWPTDLPDLPLKDNGRPERGSQQELQEQLTAAMMQSISNRNSSDAVVPLVVFGDPTLGDNFKPEHILLERPDDAKAWSERMETYTKRYARGVELPIESVQGMGPANHWTAWVIKEDKWRFYILPIAEAITGSLSKNFLRPALKELGYSMDIIKDAKVIADGSALIEKPDKSDAAIRLAQLGGYLSDEAVRRETGFNEEDAGDGERAADKTRLQELPVNFRNGSDSTSKG